MALTLEGRPSFDFTPDVLEKIERYASRGLTKKYIAQALGITQETIMAHQRKQPEIKEAYNRGKAQGIAFVADKLMKLTEEGNVTAMIFYLKAVGKWRENINLEVTGKANKPITIEARHKSIDEIMNQRFKEVLNKDKESENV